MEQLIIDHQDFGIELFRISEANYNLYEVDDNLWEFVVQISTDSAIQRSAELEPLVHAKPNLEATVLLKKAVELSKGTTLSQNVGYDSDREEYLSNIYYFAHETVEPFKLKVLETGDGHLTAELAGSTVINGSNGSNPDAQIFTIAKLKRVHGLRRRIQ